MSGTFKCAAVGCGVRVFFRGDLCGMCAEQPVDDFEPDEYCEDDEEDSWDCAYPGECLMGYADHLRCECYTIEDAEEMDGGV